MRKFLLNFSIVISVLFLGSGCFLSGGNNVLEAQKFAMEPLMVVKADGSSVELSVAIADSHEERVKGLQGVSGLGSYEGMWFVFSDDAVREFWMKDMQISLDIIFVDADFRVTTFVENAAACSTMDPEQVDCTHYSSVESVRYALELKAGSVKDYGIQVGDTIRWPVL
ncbi:MAG: DUF192 domain-containing protein [Candidatus Gracilibacteria bacterium]